MFLWSCEGINFPGSELVVLKSVLRADVVDDLGVGARDDRDLVRIGILQGVKSEDALH